MKREIVEEKMDAWRYEDREAWAICRAIVSIAWAILYLASVLEKRVGDG